MTDANRDDRPIVVDQDGGVQEEWVTPKVVRMRAGDAELAPTRTREDGQFSMGS